MSPEIFIFDIVHTPECLAQDGPETWTFLSCPIDPSMGLPHSMLLKIFVQDYCSHTHCPWPGLQC